MHTNMVQIKRILSWDDCKRSHANFATMQCTGELCLVLTPTHIIVMCTFIVSSLALRFTHIALL